MKRRSIFILYFILYLSLNLFSYDYEKLLSISKKDLKEIENGAKILERKVRRNKDNAEMNAELGFYFYNLAINEKPVAAKAVKYLEKSYKLKKDTLIKGFIGLCYTMRAGEERNLSYIDTGFKILDEACDEANNPDIKIILMTHRIGQSLEIPEFIYPRRIEVIKKDITEMEKLFKEGKLSEYRYAFLQLYKYRFMLKEGKNKAAEEIKNYLKEKYPTHPANIEISNILENGDYKNDQN